MKLRLDIGRPETRRFVTVIVLSLIALYTWGYRSGFFFDLSNVVIPFFNLTLGQVYTLFIVLIILWIWKKHV